MFITTLDRLIFKINQIAILRKKYFHLHCFSFFHRQVLHLQEFLEGMLCCVCPCFLPLATFILLASLVLGYHEKHGIPMMGSVWRPGKINGK